MRAHAHVYVQNKAQHFCTRANVWTCATAGLTFVAVNAAVGMQVSEEMEALGLDASEHGLSAHGLQPAAASPPMADAAAAKPETGVTSPTLVVTPPMPNVGVELGSV